MSTNIWEKFDKTVDVKGLKKDAQDVAENKVEYKDVPEGTYEVKVEKMELKESKTNRPMVTIWMRVLEGEYKGQMIFYNQVVDMGFGLHNANKFLRSLDSGIDVTFENFKQYNDLLLDIHEKIDGLKLEYGLKYGTNSKGYNTYEITDVFEN